MATNKNKIDPRSNRLVCAKLYEGGLLCSYKILSSIKRKPFKGKSPEFELDIDRITKEAETAFMYHMKFALIAVVLSFLGLIFHISSNKPFGLEQFIFEKFVSYAFSISAICLLLLKPVRDRNFAFENFSKSRFNLDTKKSTILETQNGTESILTKFCDWLTRNNIKPEKDEGKRQNVIIFGDYFPFLGAGKRIKNWNFVTDLSKPKKDLKSLLEPKDKEEKKNQDEEKEEEENRDVKENKEEKKNIIDELSVRELYQAVYDKINTKNLPNLSYKYILFADGNKEDEIDFLLKERKKQPNTYIENLETIKSYFEICEEGVFKDCRTYLNISHHDKNRSTLFSTFLRFSKIEKELFAECSFYVLTPIDESVYNIDRLPRNNVFTLKSIIVTVSLIIVYIIFSGSVIPALILFILTVRPLVKILNSRAKESEYRIEAEQIKRGEPHNYGLLNTFRETIASPDYKNYFSAQDIILIQNTLENAIIDSVADLLDAKGIDTSFIRSEMISFINKGIMQFGGKMENAQVVSGKGNQAIQKIQQIAEKVSNASKEVQI